MASGSIQIKSGTYYAVLNTKDANGKRKQKWVSTKLEANARNKRKAEAFLDKLLNAKSIDGDDLAEYAKEWVRMIQFTTCLKVLEMLEKVLEKPGHFSFAKFANPTMEKVTIRNLKTAMKQIYLWSWLVKVQLRIDKH